MAHSATFTDARLVIIGCTHLLGQSTTGNSDRTSQWTPQPGALDAISRLHHAGVLVALAVNQASIAAGLLDMTTLNGVHQRMIRQVESFGGRIEAVAVCPHAPMEHCPCRKPQAGLILKLIERLDVAPSDTVVIGDSLRDMGAALASGCRAWLVRSGHGQRVIDRGGLPPGVRVVSHLTAAVDQLLDPTSRLRPQAA